MISKIVFVNGIYDILCSIAILGIIPIPILDQLHLSMIKDSQECNQLCKRFFAYYIGMNGIIRLICSADLYEDLPKILVCITYILEAVIVINETFIAKTMIVEKGLFVIITSLFLVYCVAILGKL